jgi:4-diphosphocytidyl-2-C-methyl-D-erythritol kinase
MPTSVRSYSKINLGLYIGAPRPDGFHSLITVYQTLEMHDTVTVTARRTEKEKKRAIRLTSNDEGVPADEKNTAWKAVELALQDAGAFADVSIHIEKRLPIQGGLGAGSANAAAALVGIEAELRLHRRVDSNLPTQRWELRRLEIAERVGSDVPLFLLGGAVLGRDRGQEVYPLPDFEPTWCALALPEVGVSTKEAFRDWDELWEKDELTGARSDVKLERLSRAYAAAFAGGPGRAEHAGSSGVLSMGENLAGPQESALVRTGITSWIQNDFERVVFPQHPSLAEIKHILAAPDTPEAALHASLSGSGSALFGLYQTQEHAEAACQRLRAAGVKSLLTRTLPRAQYWREMLTQEEH